MRESSALPPIADLREILRLEPETGLLFWKRRPRKFFTSDKQFKANSARLDGLPAFRSTKSGYLVGMMFRKHYYAHRVVYALHTGVDPIGLEIDHINGDRADNRPPNLRAVSRTENGRNQRLFKTNSSGTPGVFWKTYHKAWQAVIVVDGRRRHLGYFHNKDDAVRARHKAEARYGFHKNHGSLPQPPEEE